MISFTDSTMLNHLCLELVSSIKQENPRLLVLFLVGIQVFGCFLCSYVGGCQNPALSLSVAIITVLH